MKICIIGKYPPIQGGVSTLTAKLAFGLAVLGHDVYVVTNAREVEPPIKIYTEELFPKLKVPDRLKIYYTNPEGKYHISFSTPFVSKLAGLAKKVVKKNNCDLILSIYLEPYGVAAQLVSLWTNVPFMVSHAGSDVGHLINNPDLYESYVEIFNNCHGILTSPKMISFFKNLKIPSEKLLLKQGHFSIDVQDYIDTKEMRDFDLNHYIDQASKLDEPYIKKYLHPFLKKQVAANSFVLGLYGKTSEFKAHINLLHAIARLDSKVKSQVSIVFLTQGLEKDLIILIRTIQELDLTKQVFMLPYIPYYMISAFIKCCHCVCYLENNFPIEIHAPRIPREVLKEGGCLVISEEIARKQSYFQDMVHFENIVLVSPSDIEKMSIEMNKLIQNPDIVKKIGVAGKSLVSIDQREIDENNELFIKQIFQITKAHFSKSQSLSAYIEKRQLYFENVFKYTASHFKSKFNQVLTDYLKSEYLTPDKTVEKQTIDLYQLLVVSDDSKLVSIVTFDYNFYHSVLCPPLQRPLVPPLGNDYKKIGLSENIRLQKMCFHPISFQSTENPISVLFKPKQFYGDSGIFVISDDVYQILMYFKDKGIESLAGDFFKWVDELGYSRASASDSITSLVKLGFLTYSK